MPPLFRLADRHDVPWEQMPRVAPGLPAEPGEQAAESDVSPGEEALERQLVEVFREVPDEWNQQAIE